MESGKPLLITRAHECNSLTFDSGSPSVVIVDLGADEGDTVREITLMPGSRVEIAEIQRHGGNHRCTFVLKENSHLVTTVFTTAVDGSRVHNDSIIKLEGRGAESRSYGISLCGGGQIENYTNTEHLAEDCSSSQIYKGIVSGSGTAVFEGRIKVAQGAQRTQAFLENHNLLLSDDAKVRTRPQLEIYADDVKCSHGATTGRLDEEAVFYMRQRGIGEAEARKLQVQGFLNDVISKVKIPEMADKLNNLAAEMIAGM